MRNKIKTPREIIIEIQSLYRYQRVYFFDSFITRADAVRATRTKCLSVIQATTHPDHFTTKVNLVKYEIELKSEGVCGEKTINYG